MFVIIYEFNVKEHQLEAFKQRWHALTALVSEVSESLGSRLHQASETMLIGYSQWLSREQWDNSHLDRPDVTALRQALMETCESVQIVYQLDVVDDLTHTA